MSVVTVSQVSPAYSLWNSLFVPIVTAVQDPNVVELGVKFTSDVAGYITGSLWSSAGARLATATFANETASGWQQVTFATPVAIQANTVYIASYHTSVGYYAGDNNYFTPGGVNNPPLHALGDGGSGGNGVYLYGSGGFPNNSYQGSNYWVDVAFASS